MRFMQIGAGGAFILALATALLYGFDAAYADDGVALKGYVGASVPSLLVWAAFVMGWLFRGEGQ